MLNRHVAAVFVFIIAAVAVVVLNSPACAEGPGKPKSPDATDAAIKIAITKSLVLIENSSAEYRKHRKCFSCHHQAAPLSTLAEARRRGFSIDEEDFAAQTKWAADHLGRGKTIYASGKGQGGGVDTAGYALWALEIGGWKADEVTSAVAGYLSTYQKKSGHWRPTSKRLPTQGSHFTSTYVALRGLGTFGTEQQADAIAQRQSEALKWLLENKGKDMQDRAFRLRSLHYLQAEKDVIDGAAKALIDTQHDDGGWAQLDDMSSDAYATATVMLALHEAGRLKTDDEAYRRGVKYLLDKQLDDGSWHVTTRARPIQKYFESGYPHGKDQFISMTAACRATTALLLTAPQPQIVAPESRR